MRRIDNEGNTVWTTRIGDSHRFERRLAYSVGFSITQVFEYNCDVEILISFCA